VRPPADIYVHEPEEEDDCCKVADELLLRSGKDGAQGSGQEVSPAKENNLRQQPQELFIFVTVGASEGDGSLGLDVDIVDSVAVVVTSIYPGRVQRWNIEHPDAVIEEGDRIVEVNGAVGNAALLVERLKMDSVWSILVQRPVEVVVSSDHLWELARDSCCPCRPHGVHVGFAERGTSLMIDKIHEGMVKDWNQANPQQVVKVRDRIIEVNGRSGQASDLVQLLSIASESMCLVIRRYP